MNTKLLGALLTFVAIIGLVFLRPLIVQDVYQWHVMNQFSLPDLAYWNVFALLILVELLKGYRIMQNTETDKPFTKAWTYIFYVLFCWLIAWVLI